MVRVALSLLLLTISVAAKADALSTSPSIDDKLRFAVVQHGVVKIIEKLNYENLSAIKLCLTQAGTEQTRYSILNVRGNETRFNAIKNCDQLLRQFIYGRLADQYKSIRYDLIVGSATRPGDDLLTSWQGGDLISQITATPAHYARNILSEWTVGIAALEPADHDEIDRALRDLSVQLEEACSNFYRHLTAPVWSRDRFCDALKKPPLKRDSEESVIAARYRQPFSTFLNDAIEDFRARKRQDYQNLIEQNPYLLLVATGSPEVPELITATETLASNAARRITHTKKYDARYRIVSLIQDFEAGKMNDGQKFVLYKKLIPFLKLKSPRVYTTSTLAENPALLKSPLKAVQASVLYDVKIDSVIDSVEDLAIVAVANFGCFALKRTTLFLGCMVTVAMPSNFFFAFDGVASYVDYLQSAFSYLESQHQLNSFSENGQKYFAMLSSTLLSGLIIPADAAIMLNAWKASTAAAEGLSR